MPVDSLPYNKNKTNAILAIFKPEFHQIAPNFCSSIFSVNSSFTFTSCLRLSWHCQLSNARKISAYHGISAYEYYIMCAYISYTYFVVCSKLKHITLN